jgi:trimethylamine:corrinoid methyltransferase-like protein
MRDIWIPGLTHPRPAFGGKPVLDIRDRARAEADRILAEHQPEPLDEPIRAELRAILDAAAKEMGV